MQWVQSDYETDLTLAVFHTPQEVDTALQRLAAASVHLDAVQRVPLLPGQYARVDTSAVEEVSGALRGAQIGVPAGAALGFGVAASLLGGSPAALAGAAGAGALAGGLLGAFEGAVLRTHFDDDVASMYRVPDADPDELLMLRTSGSQRATPRARQILQSAGAAAFLDPGAFPDASSGTPR
jgi:hypothetical protein